MDIGQAIVAIKAGQCVQRAGWTGRPHIFLKKGHTFVPPGKSIERHYEPMICMYSAQDGHRYRSERDEWMSYIFQGTFQGWFPSQADLLADDWAIVPFARQEIKFPPQYVFPSDQNSHID